MNEIAISVKNLTKKYRIFGHPGDRIKQALTFGRVRFHREFTALQDVSFEIKKGETVGIIGRSGSGKSALMPLVNVNVAQRHLAPQIKIRSLHVCPLSRHPQGVSPPRAAAKLLALARRGWGEGNPLAVLCGLSSKQNEALH